MSYYFCNVGEVFDGEISILRKRDIFTNTIIGDVSTQKEKMKKCSPSIQRHLEKSQNLDIGCVYVLKLENEKWYVGYTKNILGRIKEHAMGIGAEWTKTNKPIQLVNFFIGDHKIERRFTEELMIKFGWQNVRGARWTANEILCPMMFR
ncbi:TPA: GIY-YIG nuclease family protein [Escherichia coli]|nr:GIY-YIG nuclease family protein [Escherichia coli]